MDLDNNNLKTVIVCLLVVLIGMSAFNFGLTEIYKEPLRGGPCGICFNLNEEVTNCFGGFLYNLTKDNKINYPTVSYG